MASDQEKSGDMAARTTGGIAGGVVGIVGSALLGPFGALFGSLTTPLLTEAAKKVFQRRQARAEEAARAAEEHARMPFDEVVERASNDDRRLEIIGRALQAAAMSEEAAKIRALGWAIAEGVLTSDDAKVDESLRVVTVLGQLEPADVKVLAKMSQHNTGWDVWNTGGRPNPPTIVENVPGVETVVDHIVARLSTLGLIAKPDSGGGIQWNGSSWQVTRFGKLCVDTLEAVGATKS